MAKELKGFRVREGGGLALGSDEVTVVERLGGTTLDKNTFGLPPVQVSMPLPGSKYRSKSGLGIRPPVEFEDDNIEKYSLKTSQERVEMRRALREMYRDIVARMEASAQPTVDDAVKESSEPIQSDSPDIKASPSTVISGDPVRGSSHPMLLLPEFQNPTKQLSQINEKVADILEEYHTNEADSQLEADLLLVHRRLIETAMTRVQRDGGEAAQNLSEVEQWMRARKAGAWIPDMDLQELDDFSNPVEEFEKQTIQLGEEFARVRETISDVLTSSRGTGAVREKKLMRALDDAARQMDRMMAEVADLQTQQEDARTLQKRLRSEIATLRAEAENAKDEKDKIYYEYDKLKQETEQQQKHLLEKYAAKLSSAENRLNEMRGYEMENAKLRVRLQEFGVALNAAGASKLRSATVIERLKDEAREAKERARIHIEEVPLSENASKGTPAKAKSNTLSQHKNLSIGLSPPTRALSRSASTPAVTGNSEGTGAAVLSRYASAVGRMSVAITGTKGGSGSDTVGSAAVQSGSESAVTDTTADSEAGSTKDPEVIEKQDKQNPTQKKAPEVVDDVSRSDNLTRSTLAQQKSNGKLKSSRSAEKDVSNKEARGTNRSTGRRKNGKGRVKDVKDVKEAKKVKETEGRSKKVSKQVQPRRLHEDRGTRSEEKREGKRVAQEKRTSDVGTQTTDSYELTLAEALRPNSSDAVTPGRLVSPKSLPSTAEASFAEVGLNGVTVYRSRTADAGRRTTNPLENERSAMADLKIETDMVAKLIQKDGEVVAAEDEARRLRYRLQELRAGLNGQKREVLYWRTKAEFYEDELASIRKERAMDQTTEYLQSILAARGQVQRPAPTGRIALVFTDIEKSTPMWEKYPTAMLKALKLHNDLCRTVIAECNGYEVKTEGDAFMIAFQRAADAVRWTVEVQKRLLTLPWPEELFSEDSFKEHVAVDAENVPPRVLWRGFRVRMGVHVGDSVIHCEPGPLGTTKVDYVGMFVNRAARVADSGSGGMILVTHDARLEIEVTASMDGTPNPLDELDVVDIGEQSFRGIPDPIGILQVSPPELRGRVYHERHPGQSNKNKLKQTSENSSAEQQGFNESTETREEMGATEDGIGAADVASSSDDGLPVSKMARSLALSEAAIEQQVVDQERVFAGMTESKWRLRSTKMLAEEGVDSQTAVKLVEEMERKRTSSRGSSIAAEEMVATMKADRRRRRSSLTRMPDMDIFMNQTNESITSIPEADAASESIESKGSGRAYSGVAGSSHDHAVANLRRQLAAARTELNRTKAEADHVQGETMRDITRKLEESAQDYAELLQRSQHAQSVLEQKLRAVEAAAKLQQSAPVANQAGDTPRVESDVPEVCNAAQNQQPALTPSAPAVWRPSRADSSTVPESSPSNSSPRGTQDQEFRKNDSIRDVRIDLKSASMEELKSCCESLQAQLETIGTSVDAWRNGLASAGAVIRAANLEDLSYRARMEKLSSSRDSFRNTMETDGQRTEALKNPPATLYHRSNIMPVSSATSAISAALSALRQAVIMAEQEAGLRPSSAGAAERLEAATMALHTLSAAMPLETAVTSAYRSISQARVNRHRRIKSVELVRDEDVLKLLPLDDENDGGEPKKPVLARASSFRSDEGIPRRATRVGGLPDLAEVDEDTTVKSKTENAPFFVSSSQQDAFAAALRRSQRELAITEKRLESSKKAQYSMAEEIELLRLSVDPFRSKRAQELIKVEKENEKLRNELEAAYGDGIYMRGVLDRCHCLVHLFFAGLMRGLGHEGDRATVVCASKLAGVIPDDIDTLTRKQADTLADALESALNHAAKIVAGGRGRAVRETQHSAIMGQLQRQTNALMESQRKVAELATVRQRVHALQKANGELQRKDARRTHEVQTLREQLASISRQNQSLKIEAQDMHARVRIADHRIDTASALIEELKATLKHLMKEKEHSRLHAERELAEAESAYQAAALLRTAAPWEKSASSTNLTAEGVAPNTFARPSLVDAHASGDLPSVKPRRRKKASVSPQPVGPRMFTTSARRAEGLGLAGVAAPRTGF